VVERGMPALGDPHAGAQPLLCGMDAHTAAACPLGGRNEACATWGTRMQDPGLSSVGMALGDPHAGAQPLVCGDGLGGPACRSPASPLWDGCTDSCSISAGCNEARLTWGTRMQDPGLSSVGMCVHASPMLVCPLALWWCAGHAQGRLLPYVARLHKGATSARRARHVGL
jgi:hypothetical protein